MPPSGAQPIYDVACGAGRFVAVDNAGHFYTSTTGLTWSQQPNSNGGTQISFCNNIFIVPVGAGTNAVSSDGVNWTLLTNTSAVQFGRILYADGCFVALSGAKVFSSLDGTNWTQHTTRISPGAGLNALAFANNRSLAIGNTPYGPQVLPLAYFSDPIVSVGITAGIPPQVMVSGLTGRAYRIDQCDSLGAGSWQPVNTNSQGTVPFTWTDNQAVNSVRYYRAVLLP